MTNLSKLEIERNKTDLLLIGQLKHLELMSEDIIPEDIDSLSVRQIELENRMCGLLEEYRNVKSQLFALVETIRRTRSN